MKPERILYVNGGVMSRGGIESFMMNYYRHIDRTKLQIDFIVHGYEKGVYDDEIETLGGKIYRVPIKSDNYFRNVSALKKIFENETYKIVHSHLDAMSMIVLKIAKKSGIPIRIAHSHNTQHLTNNKIKFFLNEYARKKISKYSTHYFACSKAAGEWLFGQAAVKEGKVTFINNAIDIKKYKFNEHCRDEIRKKYNLNGHFVVGHIGRFDYQKNHDFLLETFKSLLDKKPEAILILIGDGHLREQVENKIITLNLNEKVILLGVRDNIHEIVNAFDAFCFPSVFEGLGIVLIEAQSNGLKCITSTNVPREADISGHTVYLDLDNNYDVWAKALINSNDAINKRAIEMNKYIESGYSISHEAKKLQEMYLTLCKELDQ